MRHTGSNWQELIFAEDADFDETAKKVYVHQYENCAVYHRFCNALSGGASNPGVGEKDTDGYPLLPIRAFKDAAVTAMSQQEPELVFKSSGTSDMQKSVHRIADSSIYDRSVLSGFRHFYDLDSAVIWGYTPGYVDNPHSSLIYMIQKLIEADRSGLSRFLPLDRAVSKDEVAEVNESGRQLILFGAAFGLLDLLEMVEFNLSPNSLIIETGGMKTHRREMSREQLHQRLSSGFGLDRTRVHSEYGMAELLSQAYATGGPWFRSVPWMKVTIRDPYNPFEELPPHREGLIGVVDLANVHSCSFLLTGDRGLRDKKGRFQVLGRWNAKDLRGCNFLIDED